MWFQKYSDFRMTLKDCFGKCSLSVLSANGWKDENMALRFHAKENPNRVAVWPQSKVSIDFQKVLRHEVFSPKRSLIQPKATRVCIRAINQSNRSISVRLLFLFCSRVFHFKVIRKSLDPDSSGQDLRVISHMQHGVNLIKLLQV